MDKNLALYAYFGELGFFDADIPGHSFYQIGLLDSISSVYGVDQFDFYSYLDPPNGGAAWLSGYPRPKYPDGIFGQVFNSHTDRLVRNYRVTPEDVVEGIKSKVYSKIFLKARFRNLATLAKKMTDAFAFESIITTALEAGYRPTDIIIVDTDLSMSEQFVKHLYNIGIPIIAPSITLPGIGQNFLADCLEIHSKNKTKKENRIFYYGNLSFENYKAGHEKNPIVKDIIAGVCELTTFDGSQYQMTVAAKETPAILQWLQNEKFVDFIPRTNREAIWTVMSSSNVCLNVSKDLYLEKDFTPARVYEAITCGIIPVSFKKSHVSAMAFNTVFEFEEICKFLAECSPTDYFKILKQIAESVSTPNK